MPIIFLTLKCVLKDSETNGTSQAAKDLLNPSGIFIIPEGKFRELTLIVFFSCNCFYFVLIQVL